MAKEKFKECPFCGEKIEIYTHQWTSKLKWYVECGWCGGKSPSKTTESAAIKAWNRRHNRN